MSQKLNTAIQPMLASKVNLVLSLIGYPREVSIEMAFVFGDVLICADADATKLATFSAQMGGVCSFSFDGDVYDLRGTLLVCVQGRRAAEGHVVQAEAALGEVEREFGVLRAGGRPKNKWGVLKRELENKEHEMRLLLLEVVGSNTVRVRPPFFRRFGGTVY